MQKITIKEKIKIKDKENKEIESLGIQYCSSCRKDILFIVKKGKVFCTNGHSQE